MTLQACMSGVLLTGRDQSYTVRGSGRIPMPRPGPGEVLIQILATGVSASDINTRKGWSAESGPPETAGWPGLIQFPQLQGPDLCGRVVKLGEGVTEPQIGARVLCPTGLAAPTEANPMAMRAIGSEYDRALTELGIVPAKHLRDVSSTVLTDLETDAMHRAYGTAHGLLSRAGVRRGEKILITDASGSVGMAAVRLARLRGARVTGQCRAEKADAVLAAGAVTILARDRNPAAKSFAVVIDVVGGAGWSKRLGALRPGGRYAVSGAVAGPMVEGDLRRVYLNDLTLFGRASQSREIFPGLVTIINTGGLPPPASRTYPQRDISKAAVGPMADTSTRLSKLFRAPNERIDNG